MHIFGENGYELFDSRHQIGRICFARVLADDGVLRKMVVRIDWSLLGCTVDPAELCCEVVLGQAVMYLLFYSVGPLFVGQVPSFFLPTELLFLGQDPSFVLPNQPLFLGQVSSCRLSFGPLLAGQVGQSRQFGQVQQLAPIIM